LNKIGEPKLDEPDLGESNLCEQKKGKKIGESSHKS
jgi:hypothetical protein